MKKILLSILLFSILITSAFAQQGMNENEPKAVAVGNQDDMEPPVPTLYQNGEGNPEPTLIMAQTREKAQTTEQLKEMVQQRQMEMTQEMSEMPEKEQKLIQSQNQVRLAVHSMLAMEDLVGGIGPQVSEIARQFNNSEKATIQAEEKIQKKSGFARFFTGGDEKAATELETQVEQNRNRVQELNQLMENCQDCDSEVKAMLQEQVQNLEQEQNRLSELANKEKSKKGLFGWLYK